MGQTVKANPDLDDICGDAARLLHLSQAAQSILEAVPVSDAKGNRIPAMDQLWAVLSAMEVQAQLHVDAIEAAISVAERPAAA